MLFSVSGLYLRLIIRIFDALINRRSKASNQKFVEHDIQPDILELDAHSHRLLTGNKEPSARDCYLPASAAVGCHSS